jgi:hypothetical protein
VPALFSPQSNRRVRTLLVAAVAVLCGVPAALMVWVRSAPVTGQGQAPVQPMPFDHRIHVTGLRIDCRYCHSAVERSATAGLPPSESCLPCHSRLWREGSIFEPVRRSLARNRPIPWVRVNRLPDFVYFNHAIHVTGGIACEACHGPVEEMAPVRQSAPLTMSWCLDCHRDPEPFRRPADAVTAMSWQPSPVEPKPAPLPGERIRAITTCSACHR